MNTSILNALLFAIVWVPVGVAVTEIVMFKKNFRFLVIAVGYALLALNETVFLLAGHSFYFYHMVLDSVILALAITNFIAPDPSRPYYPNEFLFHYGFFFMAMLGMIALAQIQPAHGGAGQSDVLTLALIVIAAIFLIVVTIQGSIQNKQKKTLPVLMLILLWLASHVNMYDQPVLINRFLTLALFGVGGFYVLVYVTRTNSRMFHDNHLLSKSRNAVLTMLNEVSLSPELVSSVENTLNRILETITETLNVESVALYTVGETGGKKTLKFHQAIGHFCPLYLEDNFILHSRQLTRDFLEKTSYSFGEGVIGTVAEKNEIFVIDRGSGHAKMAELGLNVRTIANLLAVPMHVKGELYGVIIAQNLRGAPAFNESDIRLLQFLGDQAGVSVANARMYIELTNTARLRQEANIAMRIQKDLLPKTIPMPEHLRIATYIMPAKEVGGDYYDFITMGDKGQGIVIGDVSGKGVPAGMIMAVAKAVIHIVSKGEKTAEQIVRDFTREMYGNIQTGMFMTLNFLRWEDSTRTLSFAGAGHEHILWFHSQAGRTEKIRAGGLAVGLVQDPEDNIGQGVFKCEKGDVVVLYTDGVTEARNKEGEMFGMGRLMAALDSYAYMLNPEKIKELLIKEIADFTSGEEQYDDMTLIVLSVIT